MTDVGCESGSGLRNVRATVSMSGCFKPPQVARIMRP